MAYELIETIEVGAGGAASIEFTSIPQDGVDLQVVVSARQTTGGNVSLMTLNSDSSGSNYTFVNLQGNGTNKYTDTISGSNYIYFGGTTSNIRTANTFGNASAYISNYTSSVAKSISTDGVTESNETTAWQTMAANTYTGTSPITTVTISRPFVQYSTASLYKIY